MPTTVTLKHLGAFAGASNLQLFLRKTSDNTLLAAGGDTGVDASSIGSFAWTVAEAIPNEQLLARVYEGASETKENIVIDSVLNVGFTEIGQEHAVLNSDTQGQIDALTRGLIAGVVGSSSSTTVVNVTSTESGLAVTDQLKGRVIIFNKDTTTAALRGQGAPIDTNDTTSITVASGDAFTTAPASGDTFTIY